MCSLNPCRSIKINPWEKLAKGEKRLVAEGLISLCLVSSRESIAKAE